MNMNNSNNNSKNFIPNTNKEDYENLVLKNALKGKNRMKGFTKFQKETLLQRFLEYSVIQYNIVYNKSEDPTITARVWMDELNGGGGGGPSGSVGSTGGGGGGGGRRPIESIGSGRGPNRMNMNGNGNEATSRFRP